MQKRWAAVFLMLWILAGTQVLKSGLSEKEEQIAQVFGRIGTEEKNSQTEYFGKVKGEWMNREERNTFLTETAEKLGLECEGGPEEEQKEGYLLTSIVKESARARTQLSIMTLSGEEQYVLARIDFEDDLHSAMYYRSQLENILEDKLEDTQNITAAHGFYKGRMTMEETEEIAQDILEALEAHVVSANKTESFYTVYGYTGAISDYIMQGDYAVNVNVAATYDEQKDRTQVYLAIPLISEEY